MSTERGSILYQTGRHDAAEKEFRAALGEDPSNALAHAMIGLCLSKRAQYDEATEEAREAIRLRPDWHFGYSALAHILLDRERLTPAAEAISKAIEIDPFNPNYHGVLAMIRLQQRLWPAAHSGGCGIADRSGKSTLSQRPSAGAGQPGAAG